MKKKILTTLFVIGAQFFSKTYASKELQVVTPTSTEGGRCLPSTIEGLGGFLRKNTSGVSFPEVGYTAFCSPFLTTRFSSRIDEMKAKNAAIEVFGQMVALAYSAFAEEIERQKKKTPGFDDIAADRQSTLLAYKMNNHTYFLKFQDMITQVLRWAETRDTTRSEANRVLTQPYGLSKDLGMVWIKDNNGLFPRHTITK